jgi:transposase
VEQQQQYVGIDLHRRRSVIVRRTATGETLDTVHIDNDPAALAQEILRAGPHPEVVLEATYGWYWAADVLQELGANVHLAHPLGNDWGKRRVKNDERDATDLVYLLRLGRLAEAWIAPPATRDLREHVRLSREAREHPDQPQVPGSRDHGEGGCLDPDDRAVRGQGPPSAGRDHGPPRIDSCAASSIT